MTASADMESLSQHFRKAAVVFGTSPLYQALCPVVAEDRPLLDLLTRRRSGQQASFLLFGAVHYLLLKGVGHRLREYYPSVVAELARAPAEAGPVFVNFCAGALRQLAGAHQTGHLEFKGT